MNKVININFQGRILPIEELAYEILKQYIQSLRTYFENEEGRDEIINDIECRIAELCDNQLKKDTVCITEADINLIISSIGRPADFEAQDGFEASTQQNTQDTSSNDTYEDQEERYYANTHQGPKRLYRDEKNKVFGGVCSGLANYFGLDPVLVRVLWVLFFGVSLFAYLILWIAVPSTSVKEVGGVRKRLFRDGDHKIIGGVCSGLAKYFGMSIWVPRVLFILPFFSFLFKLRHAFFWNVLDFPDFFDFTFSPGALFVYIVLWLILPEAKTSADKLEMRGEKVDLENIKNTIQNDMEGFGKKAQAWGSNFYKKTRTDRREARAERREERRAERNGAQNGSDENDSPAYERSGCFYFLGRAITILFKAFVYFILGVILISVLASLFGLGVVTTGLLPLRRFILEDGIQNVYVWGALLLFIWVPVIGIVTAIIRKIAGIKKANVWVRTSLWALWILGLVSFIFTITTVSGNFSKHNIPVEENIQLSNAKLDYLELTAKPKMKYYENRWFKIAPFSFYEEDTVYVRNLRIRIVQSKTDSFEVKIVKLSDGRTLEQANALAQKINFSLTQQDSTLYLDRGIAINKQDKFRNQHVIMTIAVPIGKRIKISNKGWSEVNVRVNSHGLHSETINIGTNDWGNDWENQFDDESFDFERGIEYKMTSAGLEKTARDQNLEEDNSNLNSDDPDDMEQRLNELKRERQHLEQGLEKTRAEKLRELEKIDRALEKKAQEKKDKKAENVSISSVATVTQVANKLGDLQWVVDRFTY